MRKLLIVLLGLAIFPAQALPQDQGIVVELLVDWEVGEKHEIELIKERERYRGKSRVLSGRTQTPAVVEVLQKSEEGFVIRWTYGRTQFYGEVAKPNPLAIKMANLVENMHLDLRTDPNGTVVGLQNLDEVVSHYRVATQAVIRWMKDMGASDTEVRQLWKAITPLKDPVTVEPLALNEPGLFLLPSGGSFRLGTPQEYEDQLPNPLGGESFPSKAYFLLQEVNPQENLAFIEWKQIVDPEKAARIMLETMKAMARRMNAPVPTEEGLPDISIEDVAHYVIDTKTGWPLSVTHQRTSIVGESRSIDRLNFRMLPAK